MRFIWQVNVYFFNNKKCNILTPGADNKSNQLDNSSKLGSTVNSLNLVHKPNELKLELKI